MLFQLQTGRSEALSTDVSTLKQALPGFLRKGNGLDPRTKSGRGWKSDATGQMLCRFDRDWNDVECVGFNVGHVVTHILTHTTALRLGYGAVQSKLQLTYGLISSSRAANARTPTISPKPPYMALSTQRYVMNSCLNCSQPHAS